jgi:dihydroflavonol-4-reductase
MAEEAANAPVDIDVPVLVTGASGFVGSHIARLLVARGRTVRVLLRQTSKQDALQDLPVEIFYGDVLDPDSLRTAMAGCDSVFYSVVDPRFWLSDPTPIYRNNVDGLVNAMDVALERGVKRFIFTSSMGTLGFNPDGPVTEEIPFNWHDRAPPYILARLAAEERLLEYCRERGLPGVALCVANTYGPEDYQPTPHGNALWHTANGEMTVAVDASQPTVDIRDVAESALLAEQFGRPGERYIIANEYISNREFYALATAERGNSPPRILPRWLAWTIAWLAERYFKLIGRKDYLLSTDAVFLSNAFKELDNSKARRELQWSPRPLKETVRDAVAWFTERNA